MELTIGILVVIALFIVCVTVLIYRALNIRAELDHHKADLDFEIDMAEIANGNTTYEDAPTPPESYLVTFRAPDLVPPEKEVKITGESPVSTSKTGIGDIDPTPSAIP